MRRRCCTHPSGNSTEQSFKSVSDSHLSIAYLVCATSQQHFRGQGTALRAEGDSDKQNSNISAPGKQSMQPQLWVSCPVLGELLSACGWQIWEGSSSLSAPSVALTLLSLSPGVQKFFLLFFRCKEKSKLPIQPRGELDKPSTSCLTPEGATLLAKLLCWGNDDAE